MTGTTEETVAILSQYTGRDISLEHVSRTQDFDMNTPHFHDEYEIYYLLKGDRYYFIDNQIYHIKEGDLVMIAPNQIHKTSSGSIKQHERLLLSLRDTTFPFLKKHFQELSFHAPVASFTGDERCRADRILHEVQLELIHKTKYHQEMLTLKLQELLILAGRNQAVPRPAMPLKDPKLRKIAEIAAYITEHHRERLVLDDLCRRFFISKYYLCRSFREATGCTINIYLNIRRVNDASRLLLETAWSVTRIGEETGFGTTAGFENTFRSITGMLPLQYRKRNR